MTQMNLSVKQKQDRRHREQTGGCQGRGCEGWIGRLGLADVSFFICRMDKQQSPAVQHWELSISFDKP